MVNPPARIRILTVRICQAALSMPKRNYLDSTLPHLLDKEWSSRHKGLYFACPSCGARWYKHCQGCLLEKAIMTKKAAILCKCGHPRSSHTSNSPNAGHGCDNPIETPPEFVGGMLDGNWLCGCMNFEEKVIS